MQVHPGCVDLEIRPVRFTGFSRQLQIAASYCQRRGQQVPWPPWSPVPADTRRPHRVRPARHRASAGVAGRGGPGAGWRPSSRPSPQPAKRRAVRSRWGPHTLGHFAASRAFMASRTSVVFNGYPLAQNDERSISGSPAPIVAQNRAMDQT